MNAAEIQSALDDVFDQAMIYQGFTGYMRDYEVIVSTTADPRTGIPPAHLRYLFRYCVSAYVDTTLPAQTWNSSLDDRLLDFESGVDVDGYVWGCGWHKGLASG